MFQISVFYDMLNRNIQSDNTIVIEMVRNDIDGMICFYGVNKRWIDGLECLNTWKRDLKDDNMGQSTGSKSVEILNHSFRFDVWQIRLPPTNLHDLWEREEKRGEVLGWTTSVC